MDIGTDSRLEEISDNLRDTNGEYALALDLRSELREKIEPIIMSEKEMTLDECDFMDFQEYIESESTITAIERHAFYNQDRLDCICLLRELGVLR